MGAVTATASFRFTKWIGDWLGLSGAKLIIGKGGMTSKDYRDALRPERRDLPDHGRLRHRRAARARHQVASRRVHWRKELGLAQAMWVIEAENMGPFIVESDLEGNSLFERENAKIAAEPREDLRGHAAGDPYAASARPTTAPTRSSASGLNSTIEFGWAGWSRRRQRYQTGGFGGAAGTSATDPLRTIYQSPRWS